MLKIEFKDKRKPALWLVDSTLKIGSSKNCDIVIAEDKVESVHVELIVQQNDIILRNKSPRHSVFVNEVPVIKQQKLNPWDVIRLGDSELEIIDPINKRSSSVKKLPEKATVVRPAITPWMLKALSAPFEGQYFPIAHGIIIGREDSSDIKLKLSYISRKHLKIMLRKDQLYVEDLNSANGTFVNGDKIKTSQLFNGDMLKLDKFVFQVIGTVAKTKKMTQTLVTSKAKVAKQKSVKSASLRSEKEEDQLASQRVYLHSLSGTSQGNIYEINHKKNHISHLLGHHLSRSEKSVSARHIYLQELDVGWEIKNNGAADGLLINGRMQTQAILHDKDELTIADTKLKFQCVGDKPRNYAIKVKEKAIGNRMLITFILITVIIASIYFFKLF